METHEPTAEVIASNIRSIEAEVYREKAAPAFGSWVRIPGGDGLEVFGLVSHVEVGSIDPSRRPAALGQTPDELRRERPHLFDLIRTTCRVQIVAHRLPGNETIRQSLPPRPAGIHDFIYGCSNEIILRLSEPYDFLRTLISLPEESVPVDDLLIAVLRGIYAAHGRGEAGQRALVVAGRALGRLLREDHERLQSILRRVL